MSKRLNIIYLDKSSELTPDSNATLNTSICEINNEHNYYLHLDVAKSERKLYDLLVEYENNLSSVRIYVPKITCSRLNKDFWQSIIIRYPEVNFFFGDEAWPKYIFKGITNKEESEYKDFLKQLDNIPEDFKKYFSQKKVTDSINNYKRAKSSDEREQLLIGIKQKLEQALILRQLNSNLHYLKKLEGKDELKHLLYFDNIFDASNLRYVVKRIKFSQLHLKCNFANTLNSRSRHLATVVDEEYAMARRIAYSMYACGYRALNVSSSLFLKSLNASLPQYSSKDNIIIRDFDLQMPDKLRVIPPHYKLKIKENSNEYVKAYEVDLLRGYKLLDSGGREIWIPLISEGDLNKVNFQKQDGEKIRENTYWSNTVSNDSKEKCHVFCISHGYKNLSLVKELSGDRRWEISSDKLTAPGFYKPIVGIFQSVMSSIAIINDVLNKSRDTEPLDTSREGHIHSIPLDLYNVATPLLNRADDYYNRGHYIKAAILSQEATEVLNGMHTSQSYRAFLIHSKAENAIAMSEIGGDERDLAKDCQKRIRFVINDIERLNKRMRQVSEGDSLQVKESRAKEDINILNQIFSDCRQFCHDKEHFQSEEEFIAAMAEINEGLPVWAWFRKISIKNRFIAKHLLVNNREK